MYIHLYSKTLQFEKKIKCNKILCLISHQKVSPFDEKTKYSYNLISASYRLHRECVKD